MSKHRITERLPVEGPDVDGIYSLNSIQIDMLPDDGAGEVMNRW